jgi:hypothetical protein
MKINFLSRTIEYKNKWYSVNKFKHEKILIGADFNLRKYKKGDFKRILLYSFMPYKWLNEQFMKGNI